MKALYTLKQNSSSLKTSERQGLTSTNGLMFLTIPLQIISYTNVILSVKEASYGDSVSREDNFVSPRFFPPVKSVILVCSSY